MPTIHRFDNSALRICLHADDHAPPHFDVLRHEVECLIGIADFQVLEGEIDRRDYARAIAWVEANLDAVNAAWRKLNERG